MDNFKTLAFLKSITAVDVIDVLVVAFVIYTLFFWFKRTKAAFVFMGFLICGIAYLIFRFFKLQLAASLLQGFFAVIVIALIIIFQEEIRHLFQRIASQSIYYRTKRDKSEAGLLKQTGIIVKTAFDLAEKRIGALIVLAGRDMVMGHLHGGIELNGILSEPLLKSIFDPHSIGHDGAVVIEDGKVVRFASRLPLSKESEKLKDTGLRHAAALGLSESADALCIVVSEERGTVSISRQGEIESILDKKKMVGILEDFQQNIRPLHRTKSLRSFFMENAKEKLAAVLIAMSLWFIFVHGSEIIYKSFYASVSPIGLPDGYVTAGIEPGSITVVLSGQRRDFYFVGQEDVKVVLRLFYLDDIDKLSGEYYEASIAASDVVLPASLSIVNTIPRSVKLRIERRF